MNLTKKLIFGLLLAGALFTTACGDGGHKEGDKCTKAGDCGDALMCNTTMKKCEKKPATSGDKLANGEACTKSKECQSDVCNVNTGKCVAPVMPKGCTQTSDCTAKEVCGVFMSGSMKICTPKCDADPDICPTKYPCGEVTTADSPSTKVQACSTSH